MSPERISPRFWDFTWSGTDVADGLQEQTIYADVMESLIQKVHEDLGAWLEERPQMAVNYAATVGAHLAWREMSNPACRVVMVSPEQFQSLPQGTHHELIEAAADAHPPFPITYFDVAGPSGMGIPIHLTNPDVQFGGTGKPWISYLCGVIFHDFDDALTVIPVLRERKTLPNGMHILVPGRISFMRPGGTRPEKQCLADVVVIDGEQMAVAELPAAVDDVLRGHLNVGRMLADRCLPLLQLLESVNVDLEDAPLRAKQEKTAQRKARLRPLVIAVQRKVRRQPLVPAGEPTRKLTVQFEVRGHFKHFGPGTQVYRAAERCQPEKIRDRPGRGPCVRYWCPPYVKGPVDAPLILKARRISGDDARRGHEEEVA